MVVVMLCVDVMLRGGRKKLLDIENRVNYNICILHLVSLTPNGDTAQQREARGSMDAEVIKRFRERVRQVEQQLGWSQRNDIQCCGVTMAQCHALLAIGERKEISIVELAGMLGVDTSNLSRTVDNMVKSGLLNRLFNPQDRRYVSLTLTDEGKKAFDTIEHLFNVYLTRVFEFIPEDKHLQIMESLDMVAGALEQCGKKYRCCGSE